MPEALGFFALVEVVGLAAVPLASLAFGRLPGAGLGFAKPLGLLLLTWSVWMLVSVTPVRYSTATILVVAGVLGVDGRAGRGAAAGARGAARRAGRRLVGAAPRRVDRRAGAARAGPRAPPAVHRLGGRLRRRVLRAMALLVAYSPDVWGTEKPMDMAFINAANASSSFPPHDPWMAGEELNYYYLGHLAMAMVIKVAGVSPDEGYNLALALLAGALGDAPRSRSPARCGRPRGRG